MITHQPKKPSQRLVDQEEEEEQFESVSEEPVEVGGRTKRFKQVATKQTSVNTNRFTGNAPHTGRTFVATLMRKVTVQTMLAQANGS